jgi:hypothetical protein
VLKYLINIILLFSVIFLPIKFPHQNSEEFSLKNSVFTLNKITLLPNKLIGVLLVMQSATSPARRYIPCKLFLLNVPCGTADLFSMSCGCGKGSSGTVMTKRFMSTTPFCASPSLPTIVLPPNTQWAECCVSLWNTCLMMTQSLSASGPPRTRARARTHTHIHSHAFL